MLSASNSSFRTPLFAGLLLLLIPVTLFWKVQSFDFVNWDDDLYIYENPSIRSINISHMKEWLTKPYVSLYVPVPMLSYALDYQIGGNQPGGYHRTNLMIHLINGLLVFLLLSFFFHDPFLCFLGALLFSIHPAQTESVAWISERKNLLLGFFTLAGWNLFLRKGQHALNRTTVTASTLWIIALLSKVTAIVLPFLVFLYDFIFKKITLKKTIFYSALAVIALLAAVSTALLYPPALQFFQKHSLSGLVLRSCGAMLLYLKIIFFPFDLKLFYVNELIRLTQLTAGFAAAVFLLIFIYCITRKKPSAFWLGWFIFFILPVVFIIPVPVSNHHVYLPLIGMIGLSLLVASRYRKAVILFLTLSCLLSMILSASQLKNWKNSESLWLSALRQDPKNHQALVQLAHFYLTTQNFSAAEENYRKAVEYSPELFTYLNLGNFYLMTGQTDKTEKLALEIQAKFPNHGAITVLRSGLALSRGDTDQTIHFAEDAIRRGIRSPAIYQYLGQAQLQKANYSKALSAFQSAYAAGDRAPDTLFRVGIAQAGSGEWERAFKAFLELEKTGVVFPKLYFQMGYMRLKLNDISGARYYYKLSIQSFPAVSEAYDHLGLLELRNENLQEAKQLFESALRLKPDSVPYQNHLQAAHDQLQKKSAR